MNAQAPTLAPQLTHQGVNANCDLAVVLVSTSPLLRAFVAGLSEVDSKIEAQHVRTSASLETLMARVTTPSVIAIDMSSSIVEAREICELASRISPCSPRVALLYCARLMSSWHLEAVCRRELAGILDLYTPVDFLAASFRAIARGATVVRLESEPARSARVVNGAGRLAASVPLTDEDAELVSLGARGLSEERIGAIVHLSSHTVHHRLERLRHTIGLRNRIELAAWAGSLGFYEIGPAGDPLWAGRRPGP
jgi:DNA-binding NarL/FixJ family response regulator